MEKTNRQGKAGILSLFTVLLCTILVFVAAKAENRDRPFPLGDLSGVDRAMAEAAYHRSGDSQDLIYLLKVLCYDAEVKKDSAAADSIVRYGTELLERAKSGAIDLEALGEEDTTLLDLLKLMRSYGAK